MTDLSDAKDYTMHGPYQAASGGYGLWDARLAFAGITKGVTVARTPVEAVLGTQLALRDCVAGEPGPVAMLYSASSLEGELDADAQPRIYAIGAVSSRTAGRPADADLDRAAARLASAQRGVIIAGNGVRVGGAVEQVRELAELLDFPVATTASGKGCFAEDHELALGVFGNFGTAVANSVIGQADTVLVIGSKLGATDTALENPLLLDPERQSLVQIDIEALNVGRHFPVEVGLVGNAADVIAALAARCAPAPRAAAERLRAVRAEAGFFDASERSSDAVPIMPHRLIAELQRALPDNAIITCDAGENRIFMAHHFQTRAGQELLMAAGVGPMGYSIPAALAAKRLHPDRPVIATTGDGGFGMAMNGLLTAIEYELGIVVVVFNNAVLGWSSHGGAPSPAWRDFDFAGIARSMGCRAWRVTAGAELADTLKQALEPSAGPAVIDVSLSSVPTFRDVTSALVARTG
jgi:acetolactate synthase-1/2/3 large subunit